MRPLLQRNALRWQDRQAMECRQCQDERRRRCRVIDKQHDLTQYRQGIFALAPFVHPFRRPTNHAQRLRSLQFARGRGLRILWVVADDEVVSKDKLPASAQSAQSKQAWLTYNDRFTSGIPGFMPLILDLPVRFTCEPERGDRFRGVFTNA